jgi:hypothetical protein
MKIAQHDVDESVPHHVDEVQSDRRGIKEGWYVMDKNGKLMSGPFSSRENCLGKAIS